MAGRAKARKTHRGLRPLATVALAAVVVGVLGVLALATIRVATHSATTGRLAQKLADPAYFNLATDAADWNRLIGSTPGQVGIVVTNALNGPGNELEPALVSVIQREHATGTKVLAYVDTGYFGTTGLRTRSGLTTPSAWTSQIERDVNTWYSFYGSGLDGVFFDEGQDACGPTSDSNAWADLYRQINNYLKTKHPGAMTVINPGTVVPKCYENAADVLVTYEGSYADYVNNYRPLAWKPVDPSKVWHLIYGAATTSEMQTAISLSKRRNAGYVYVTNDVLANPYDTLPNPSYWSDEQSLAAPESSLGTTPSPPAR